MSIPGVCNFTVSPLPCMNKPFGPDCVPAWMVRTIKPDGPAKPTMIEEAEDLMDIDGVQFKRKALVLDMEEIDKLEFDEAAFFFN